MKCVSNLPYISSFEAKPRHVTALVISTDRCSLQLEFRDPEPSDPMLGLGRWAAAEPNSADTCSQRIWIQSLGILEHIETPGASAGSVTEEKRRPVGVEP